MCCLMTKMDALRLIILQMEHISLALIMMTGLRGSYRNYSPAMPIIGSQTFANSCKILRDQYIEKVAHEIGRKYLVTVATSDGTEQVIIRGQGCHLLSAKELLKERRDGQSCGKREDGNEEENRSWY